MIGERYIDPFTDFGFKKIFGSEPNKDLLIDFINVLMDGKITDLTYTKNDHLGRSSESRKAVFDLYCETTDGEKIIIELQKVSQKYFKDRSIYYASFPIQEQGPVGENWNYELPRILTIAIMDFSFDNSHPDQFLHRVKLKETSTGEVFYDKLTFVYIEVPKFSKSEDELVSHFDKWIYLLKNLNKLTEIPVSLQQQIFKKVFSIAELINLNKEEMTAYETNLKYKRDLKNAMDYAEEQAIEKGMAKGIEEGMEKGMEKGIEKGLEKGIEKGRQEEKLNMAKKLKMKGMDIGIISEVTGLSPDEIEKIEKE